MTVFEFAGGVTITAKPCPDGHQVRVLGHGESLFTATVDLSSLPERDELERSLIQRDGQVADWGDRLLLVADYLSQTGGAAADFTAYAEPGASQRDLVRRGELLDIAGALAEFERVTGRFPSTGGVTAVGSANGAIGVLCQFQDELGVETVADVRERPFTYGYWYQSDGTTFTLYAAFELPILQDESCRAPESTLSDEPHVFCMHG